jgi:hypothetical protein
MLRVDLIDIPGSTRHLNVEAMMSRLPNRFDWRPKWVLGRHFPWELFGRYSVVSLSIGLAMEPKIAAENLPVSLRISLITPIIWRLGCGT